MNDTAVLSNSTSYTLVNVPIENAHLLPASPVLDFGFRVVINSVLPFLGIITNVLNIIVILKCKLSKNWTYGMIIHLSVADLLNCLNKVMFFLPGLVMGRLVMRVY